MSNESPRRQGDTAVDQLVVGDVDESRDQEEDSAAGKVRPRGRRPARETEQEFIEAATKLFAEKGYNGTSIHDLADALNLTTASLYYHMSGKEDLLFRVLESGMANFLGGLEIIFESSVSPREKLRLAATNHVDFVLSNPTAVAVFLRERRFLPGPQQQQYSARVDKYDRMFSIILTEAMDAGDIPRGDVTLLRLSALGMVNWAVEWYRNDGRLSKEKVGSYMLDAVLYGLFGLDSSDSSES
jgi:AcrR family transcriptional regulator